MLRVIVLAALAISCSAFIGSRVSPMRSNVNLQMSTQSATDDLNLAALPTIEEWMGVCNPELMKTTMAMFKSVKEISYKVSFEGYLGSRGIFTSSVETISVLVPSKPPINSN